MSLIIREKSTSVEHQNLFFSKDRKVLDTKDFHIFENAKCLCEKKIDFKNNKYWKWSESAKYLEAIRVEKTIYIGDAKIKEITELYSFIIPVFLHNSCNENIIKNNLYSKYFKKTVEEKETNIEEIDDISLLVDLLKKKSRDKRADHSLLNKIIEIIIEKTKGTFHIIDNRYSQSQIPSYQLCDEKFFLENNFEQIIYFLQKFYTENQKITYFDKLFKDLIDKEERDVFIKLFENILYQFSKPGDFEKFCEDIIGNDNKLSLTTELKEIFITHILESDSMEDEDKLTYLQNCNSTNNYNSATNNYNSAIEKLINKNKIYLADKSLKLLEKDSIKKDVLSLKVKKQLAKEIIKKCSPGDFELAIEIRKKYKIWFIEMFILMGFFKAIKLWLYEFVGSLKSFFYDK